MLNTITSIANRSNRKNNEMFPTKHPSVLNFTQKAEELSRETAQKSGGVRRDKAVPDKLETVNIPPFPCSYLKFKTRDDCYDSSRRPRGNLFFY